MKDGRLVYSTEAGRICPDCSKPASQCVCRKKKKQTKVEGAGLDDGVVRVRREVKGRKGKTVTAVFGLPLEDRDLRDFAKKLKVRCGTGGSVKDGVIVVQGDHRDAIMDEIKKAGYAVKLAGG